MSKFNIGDRVVIADPAYIVLEGNAEGYVSPALYGKSGVVRRVKEEDTGSFIGTAYEVEAVRDGFTQTISQRYLTAAPPEPVKPVLADGVYRTRLDDTVLVLNGKAVEILESSDDCPREDHAFWLNEHDALDGATRLVAADAGATAVPDGVYTDSDGDVVHVKDNEVRYLHGSYAAIYNAEDIKSYGPYIPLVQEGSTK